MSPKTNLWRFWVWGLVLVSRWVAEASLGKAPKPPSSLWPALALLRKRIIDLSQTVLNEGQRNVQMVLVLVSCPVDVFQSSDYSWIIQGVVVEMQPRLLKCKWVTLMATKWTPQGNMGMLLTSSVSVLCVHAWFYTEAVIPHHQSSPAVPKCNWNHTSPCVFI